MKHKRTLVFLGILLLAGLAWGLVLYFLIPMWWFPAYPVIPAAFVLICLTEHLFFKLDNRDHKKWLHTLMVQRLMRWVVLLLALILLIRLANPPRLALLVSFMGFFIGYTLLCVIALRNE